VTQAASRAWLAIALVVAAAAGGCSKRPAPPPDPRASEVTVFAAASLRDVLPKIAYDFEAAHPGLHAVFQFSGSQELRVQIEHGARADLFMSADDVQVGPLLAAGLVEPPTAFASNELAVVTPAQDPAGLTAFGADAFWHLPDARRIAIGVHEVPVGRATERMLDRAVAVRGPAFRDAVLEHVVTRELNVRQTLAKAVLGEVDAAVVYHTDAIIAGASVRRIAVPPVVNVVTTYQMAVIKGGKVGYARAFAALVVSDAGRARLVDAGFKPPVENSSNAKAPGTAAPKAP
jgi:molybdate transport system substrate-binding protein